MSGTITVLQPGALSTVQDCGRVGYQRLGVSVSGAMDSDALFLGNRLVGNDPCAAAIEVTLGGAEFRFDEPTTVAVTGGELSATLDGLRMSNWTTVRVPAGGVVAFGGPSAGLRAYLCVTGGVVTEPQLGSRSTHVRAGLGGVDGRQLGEGDVLPVGEANEGVEPGWTVPPELRPGTGSGVLNVRVVPGPQADSFADQGRRTFYESSYTVTDKSDRQGIRFDGPEIQAVDGRYDIVSDAVALGSIQVPGDGKPIVLMADRQTTGGYAKIGVVATVDLPLLAQAQPGTEVRFTEVDVATAQRLFRERASELSGTPLEPPKRSGESVLQVNGNAHRINLNGLSPGAPFSFIDVEVDGSRLGVHVEVLGTKGG